eukprot:6182531-Pleurochrysis_carterae.AAC.2
MAATAVSSAHVSIDAENLTDLTLAPNMHLLPFTQKVHHDLIATSKSSFMRAGDQAGSQTCMCHCAAVAFSAPERACAGIERSFTISGSPSCGECLIECADVRLTPCLSLPHTAKSQICQLCAFAFPAVRTLSRAHTYNTS